jgi:hypothetical protein
MISVGRDGARVACELAGEGDLSLLKQRLRAGCASRAEQALAADLLPDRTKGRKRLANLLAEDRGRLAAEFVLRGKCLNGADNNNRESLVAEAATHFSVGRSTIFKTLKAIESK